MIHFRTVHLHALGAEHKVHQWRVFAVEAQEFAVDIGVDEIAGVNAAGGVGHGSHGSGHAGHQGVGAGGSGHCLRVSGGYYGDGLAGDRICLYHEFVDLEFIMHNS